jgi:hypothetical protein
LRENFFDTATKKLKLDQKSFNAFYGALKEVLGQLMDRVERCSIGGSLVF